MLDYHIKLVSDKLEKVRVEIKVHENFFIEQDFKSSEDIQSLFLE